MKLYGMVFVGSPFIILLLSLSLFAQDRRPFWTEKSSFSEGDRVYFVGVASNVKTTELGRKLAAANAKVEALNYFQMSDLSFLKFETQMTFEEKQKNGTLNIFRLMFIDRENVSRVKSKKVELAQKSEEMSADLEIARSTSAEWDKKQIDYKKRFKLLRPGMNEVQVVKIMGEPVRKYESSTNDTCLNYQEYTFMLHRDSGLYDPEHGYYCK